MDSVFNYGQTVLSMKDNGIEIKLKVKEHFGIQKEMYMMVISKTIKLMDMAYIHI